MAEFKITIEFQRELTNYIEALVKYPDIQSNPMSFQQVESKVMTLQNYSDEDSFIDLLKNIKEEKVPEDYKNFEQLVEELNLLNDQNITYVFKGIPKARYAEPQKHKGLQLPYMSNSQKIEDTVLLFHYSKWEENKKENDNYDEWLIYIYKRIRLVHQINSYEFSYFMCQNNEIYQSYEKRLDLIDKPSTNYKIKDLHHYIEEVNKLISSYNEEFRAKMELLVKYNNDQRRIARSHQIEKIYHCGFMFQGKNYTMDSFTKGSYIINDKEICIQDVYKELLKYGHSIITELTKEKTIMFHLTGSINQKPILTLSS